MKKKQKGSVVFLLIFFLAGAIGLNISATQEIFQALVPWSLILSYVILMAYHRSKQNLKTILVFVAVAMGGFLLEVLGVMSGHIFGQYTYGDTLGWQIFDVPLLIGLNWAMLVYCTHLILNKLNISPFWVIILGGLLMTAYDFLMEPAAVALGMWQWEGNLIPIQNYVAWFILSAIFLAFLHSMKLRYRNAIALPLFFIQAGFFGIQHLLVFLKPML